VFENRVLRRIFGPKKDEVTGEWVYRQSVRLPPTLLRIVDDFYFLQ
jgi:hypothetical protein